MIFKQQATHFAETIQMEKYVGPVLQTEVTSIPIVVDAPAEVVWQLIGGSAISDWSPFRRIHAFLESISSPSRQMFSSQILATHSGESLSDVDPPEAPPLPETGHKNPAKRQFTYELQRSAKGMKWRATCEHRVWRIIEDGREKTKYQLYEQFYAPQALWDRTWNPGVLETSMRPLLTEFKSVCEEKGKR
ncbi:hypothetical protein PHLGIDRAFT_130868 [Phlebiopsis gigantea 11061_1 CR5-6]|uniref:Uncharacterized protein n=1 Tax=Phlebiopsis gigantea (strain 11061_1 CR5-6) TaxID=745531 RepID=A0A0C3RQP3_PHLG1|nr:hypothetical protein PHLGIDRAFT_130868 [Phlebiopsis gigantea 11061_1 CR5-6]